MSGALDIGARHPSTVAFDPLPSAPLPFGERFARAWEEQRLTGRSTSRDIVYFEAFEQAQEAFRGIGVPLVNPWAVTDTPEGGRRGVLRPAGVNRAEATTAWLRAAEEARRRYPDRADAFPTPAEVMQQGEERAASAWMAARAAEASPTGGAAAFLGTAGSLLADPVQLATLPLGGPARLAGGTALRILQTALIEAGIAAGTQALVDAAAAPWRVSIGLPDASGGNIAEAAAAGAVLGGGARALVEGWRALRGGGGALDPLTALRGDDAEAVLRQQGRDLAGNPGGPEAAPAHQAALDAATEAVAAGRHAPEPAPPLVYRSRVERGFAPQEMTAGRFEVHTPAGRAVLAEPQLMELEALIVSHLEDGRANPAYPHAEGVQPRDRASAPSRAQVDEIAAKLAPERLAPSPEAGAGAPLVGPDGVVESGNGRVMALRRVFADPALAGQKADYLDWLGTRGLDAAGYRQPVLVSRRVSALSGEQRRAFVREANSRGTLAMTAAEQARADAGLVRAALPHWRGGAIDAEANAEFRRTFLAGMTAEERGSLLRSDGGLSAEGGRRIRAALLARAYGDELGPLLERLLEGEVEGYRAVAGALADNAADWATLRELAARGGINPAMDTTADLALAVATLDLARAKGIGVRDLAMQADFDRPLTEGARAWLATFFGDAEFRQLGARPVIRGRIGGYIGEALKSQPGRDMFGTPPAAAEETMRALDPQAGRRAELLRTSREVEAAAAAPEVPDAELAEARRVAAAEGGDIAVPVGTGEEAGTMGARALLDRAEDDIAAAAQAASCLVGVAA